MKTSSSKLLPIFAAGAVIICSIIRFFQYVSIIDFETGFYNRGAEPMGNLIYIVSLVCCAVLIVLAVFGKKKGDAAYTLSSDGTGEHATQFLGISMLIGAFLIVWNAFGSEGTAQGVATFVAAAAFLGAGFVLLKNVVPPVYTGFFMTVGAIYTFLRTCKYFTGDLVILNHSDSLLTLMAYVFFTAFLASSARFYCRFETKHSRMREVTAAGAAFIFCGTHVLSKAFGYAFGGSTVKGMSGINTDIAAGMVISGVFLFVLFLTRKSKDIVYLSEDMEKSKKEKAETADPLVIEE